MQAASFELSKVDDLGVRQRMIHLFNEVDHSLAVAIAKNIGVSEPGEPKHKNHMRKSNFLSMIDSPYTKADTIVTRKVATILADGYRASELAALRAGLKAEGAVLVVIGMHKGAVVSDNVPSVVTANVSDEHKEQVSAYDPTSNSIPTDFTIFNCKSVLFDAVALIGGEHVEVLSKQGSVQGFIAEAMKHGKIIAAMSEAVSLLEPLCKLAQIKLSTEKDQGTVVDQGIVSSQKLEDEFNQQFAKQSKQHRFWKRADQLIPV